MSSGLQNIHPTTSDTTSELSTAERRTQGPCAPGCTPASEAKRSTSELTKQQAARSAPSSHPRQPGAGNGTTPPVPTKGAFPRSGCDGTGQGPRAELSERETAIVQEIAAAVGANPAKAGDLIAIALSHHPNLAHRMVMESIKRCPGAAARVLAAARMSRSIGARLVFSTLFALFVHKLFGFNGQAQAAETAAPDSEPNAQHAQVAAFLAGLNAALALMPNKTALADDNAASAGLDVVDDAGEAAESSHNDPQTLTSADPGISQGDPDLARQDVLAIDAENPNAGQSVSPSGVSTVSDTLSLDGSAVADSQAEALSLARVARATPADPDAKGSALATDPQAQADSGEGTSGVEQAPVVEPVRKILDAPNADGFLVGGAGQDWLYGGDGHDVLLGRGGDDRLYGGTGRDILLGEGGNDQIYGGHGRDFAWGGAGDDLIEGGSQSDQLNGGTGDDILMGGVGSDTLSGDEGNDALFGDGQNDLLRGGDGNDLLDGGGGEDRLLGEGGDDLLIAGSGDILNGGDGEDTASFAEAGGAVDADLSAGGSTGAVDSQLIDIEHLVGSDYDDRLVGDDGGNSLSGGHGSDWLEGGAGDDTLAGGADSDILAGGLGDDSYVVSARHEGFDIVVDNEGHNRVVLQDTEPGALVWAQEQDGGYLDIMLRGSDGTDTIVLRILDFSEAPEALVGVEIAGRSVDTASLLAQDELIHGPSGPPSVGPQADILDPVAADTAPGAGPDVVTDILALDPAVDELPDGAQVVAVDGSSVELTADSLGQAVLRLHGHGEDALVWGAVSDEGALEIFVRVTADEDLHAATVDGHADNPDALAAVEINGRSVTVPDLLLGADLVPAETLDASEALTAAAVSVDGDLVTLEIEDAAGETIETVVVDAVSESKAATAAWETPEEEAQADGL